MTEETKRRKAAKRAYYFANKEKLLARQKIYALANRIRELLWNIATSTQAVRHRYILTKKISTRYLKF